MRRAPGTSHRRRGVSAVVLSLALGLLPHPSRAQTPFLPAAATTALGLDTLAAGAPSGALRLSATLEPLDTDLTEALVTVFLLEVGGSGAARMTAVIDRFDEVASQQVLDVDLGEGLDGCHRIRWVVPLPEDLREIAIVFESEAGWGATPVVEGGEGPDESCTPLHRSRPTSSTANQPEPSGPRGSGATSSAASSPSVSSSATPDRGANRSQLIRILPPAGELRGTTRFRTVVTSAAVERVAFHLDGELISVARRAPFSARLDLGPEVRAHRIRAVALAADGTPLGADEIEVNPALALPAVSFVRIDRLDSTTTEVEAEVQIPPGATLDHVEFYWNQDLQIRLEEAPFRTTLATPSGGSGADFLRVVAHYGDGSWVEDVHLVGAGASGEEISVNLVEVYAVLSDSAGNPVRDLTATDLSVASRGQAYTIERFQPAEDLPLSLGLILDTSESMWTLMPDTKRAAAMFLSRMLSERDRAFLVDFDNQPRLAQASTGDVVALVSSLGALVADGATAMFDAIAFASLQFDDAVGRRAMVLLTDGDDYRSKLGLNKALQQARQAGAPVYVIGLGGLDGFRRDLKTIDIEAIAQSTGGRVFLVQSMEELGEAYNRIEADLRGQYLIAFSTPEPLTQEELAKLKVRSRRRDLEVRVVVSPFSR